MREHDIGAIPIGEKDRLIDIGGSVGECVDAEPSASVRNPTQFGEVSRSAATRRTCDQDHFARNKVGLQL